MSIRKQNVKRSVYRNGANIGNLSALIFMFALLILWQLSAMKVDRKSTRQNSSHNTTSRMPSSA